MEQSDFYRRLGDRIRTIRSTERDISQEEFANRVNLSRPSIVNIEKGRQQISTYQLVIFAVALGISPSELLSLDIDKPIDAEITRDAPDGVPDEFRDWYSKIN